jgi:hypothetical protein
VKGDEVHNRQVSLVGLKEPTITINAQILPIMFSYNQQNKILGLLFLEGQLYVQCWIQGTPFYQATHVGNFLVLLYSYVIEFVRESAILAAQVSGKRLDNRFIVDFFSLLWTGV